MRHAWLLLALTLSACVTAPPVITGHTSSEATALKQWSARGRLGVSSPEQSGSGAFVWQQQGNNSDLSLRGPAGMGALNMSLQGSVLTLRAGDGSQFDADAALAELEQRLGVALPMNAFAYWLRGIPAPGESQWLDAAHNQLEQFNWSIRYEEWSTQDVLRLPLRMTLQRDAVRVVVRVQNWQADE